MCLFFFIPYLKYICLRRETCHSDVFDSETVSWFWGLTSDFAGIFRDMAGYVVKDAAWARSDSRFGYEPERVQIHQQTLRLKKGQATAKAKMRGSLHSAPDDETVLRFGRDDAPLRRRHFGEYHFGGYRKSTREGAAAGGWVTGRG